MSRFWIVTETGKRIKLGNIRIFLFVLSSVLLIAIAILNGKVSSTQEQIYTNLYNVRTIENHLYSAKSTKHFANILVELKPSAVNPDKETLVDQLIQSMHTDLKLANIYSDGILIDSLLPIHQYNNKSTSKLESRINFRLKTIQENINTKIESSSRYSTISYWLLIITLILQLVLGVYQYMDDKATN